MQMLYIVCYAVEHHFQEYEYKTIIHVLVASEKPHKSRENQFLSRNISY